MCLCVRSTAVEYCMCVCVLGVLHVCLCVRSTAVEYCMCVCVLGALQWSTACVFVC